MLFTTFRNAEYGWPASLLRWRVCAFCRSAQRPGVSKPGRCFSEQPSKLTAYGTSKLSMNRCPLQAAKGPVYIYSFICSSRWHADAAFHCALDLQAVPYQYALMPHPDGRIVYSTWFSGTFGYHFDCKYACTGPKTRYLTEVELSTDLLGRAEFSAIAKLEDDQNDFIGPWLLTH